VSERLTDEEMEEALNDAFVLDTKMRRTLRALLRGSSLTPHTDRAHNSQQPRALLAVPLEVELHQGHSPPANHGQQPWTLAALLDSLPDYVDARICPELEAELER
jgi:hypothetical protein